MMVTAVEFSRRGYAVAMTARPDDDRVSLDGLTPEEALRALLAVKPGQRDDAPEEQGDSEAPDVRP